MSEQEHLTDPQPQNPTFAIERIRHHIIVLNEFNSHRLEDIILTENGEPMHFTAEQLNEWRFTGLVNKDFVEMEGWNLKAIESDGSEDNGDDEGDDALSDPEINPPRTDMQCIGSEIDSLRREIERVRDGVEIIRMTIRVAAYYGLLFGLACFGYLMAPILMDYFR